MRSEKEFSFNTSFRRKEFPFNGISFFANSFFSILFLLILKYLSVSSMPIPFLSKSPAAISVLPLPKNGSKTQASFFVKKRINSVTKLSGNFAGCKISLSFLRGGV